jgi:hypothetical protein
MTGRGASGSTGGCCGGGRATIIPGARDLVRAQLHRQGLRPGEGVMTPAPCRTAPSRPSPSSSSSWAPSALLLWARPPHRRGHRLDDPMIPAAGWPGRRHALFFWIHRRADPLHAGARASLPETPRGHPAPRDHARRPALHHAPRLGLHQPGLARPRGPGSMGGAGRLPLLRPGVFRWV